MRVQRPALKRMTNRKSRVKGMRPIKRRLLLLLVRFTNLDPWLPPAEYCVEIDEVKRSYEPSPALKGIIDLWDMQAEL